MPKINSLEVVHQDTNKDSYQNLHDILVALNKSLALEKEVVDDNARAAIENLLEMYVNDKEAFLKSLQTLTTEFKNSQAIYSEEILLLASQLEAQAKRTTTLNAQTESQIATVTQYSEAVASEVERKTTTYTQDTEPTGTFTYGDLWIDTDDNNRTYSWNGLVWVDITRVPTYRQTTAPATAAEGELWMDTDDNNKMHRWNGSSWVATDDTRIAKSYARWGVNVDVNGHVAGIQLNADDVGTSEFTVLADNFRVFKSGYTSSPMFAVGTVNGVNTVSINGNLVVDGTILTKGIANNAITTRGTWFGTSPASGNGAWQLVAYATVSNPTSTGIANMLVTGNFSCVVTGSTAGKYMDFKVEATGSNATSYTYGQTDAYGYPALGFTHLVPSGGTTTYNVYFWGTDSSVTANKFNLYVVGLLK
jgi:hypothetical protein